MEWNVVAECVSLVILSIIWMYARKGSHLPTLKNKIFRGCLIVTFVAILTNILSTIMIYFYQIVPMVLTWIVTSVYFVFTPLMGTAYFLYTVAMLYTNTKQMKRIIMIGIIPAMAYILLIVINPFTHILFNISIAEGYTRGVLIATTYLVFYAYCVACIVITLMSYKKTDKQIYHILSAFPILAVIVVIVQQMYPNVILSGSAATCALLIIYLHLENKQISLDYLTGLPNRQELLNMLELIMNEGPDHKFVLMVVSLRDFRQINNTCGQQKGDTVLKSVSRFLYQVGPSENVYRFSGDEFALLFLDDNIQNIENCVEVIQKKMKEMWQVDDYRFVLSAVIGIIHHSHQNESVERVINAIEYAVSQAKTQQNKEVCYCDETMLAELERKRQIIEILKEKIEHQSFEMYYQPIYSIRQNHFHFAESLMRIPDSPIGAIGPAEFIPIAEETGLIIEMTYIMLNKVCHFINRLIDEGIQIESIHVNFSAIQFSQKNLAQKVLDIMAENHTPTPTIKIEFTESTLAENLQDVTEFALSMEKHGIKMGLDDFGTGYSNFATVINLPFGTVKLDKSLVWIPENNEKAAAGIKNITRTLRELGMKVVAEGVETDEQRELVESFGVDQIQGYYYAKPMNENDMIIFMKKHSR